MKVVWTTQALERLLEIETFIAEDSRMAAEKLIDRPISRADALAHHPDRGRRLPEMPASGLRELVVGNYRIVYRRGSEVEPGVAALLGIERSTCGPLVAGFFSLPRNRGPSGCPEPL